MGDSVRNPMRRGEALGGHASAADKGVPRTATEHDHDRILYSAAFRRLGSVTQTSSGAPTADFHNRLTHSLRVEHMGDAIATMLSRDFSLELDIPAIRAACLAHDIGHPPFGHIGEQELDSCIRCELHRSDVSKPENRIPGFRGAAPSQVKNCGQCALQDGFEGNAQSFRVVTLLETRSAAPGLGLDLTNITLGAMEKYPWLLGENFRYPRKWGAYDCDATALSFASPNGKDLHAQIMDWADDVAYAVHDIEDYYKVQLIPLQDYSNKVPSTVNGFWDFVESRFGPRHAESILARGREAAESMFSIFPKSQFRGSSEDLQAIDNMRSGLISYFLTHMEIVDGNLEIQETVSAVNQIIKELTWFHVIQNPELSMVQRGQRAVLRRLIERLREIVDSEMDELHMLIMEKDNAEAPTLRSIPSRLRRYLWLGWKFNEHYDRERSALRAVIDYVASLSDPEAYHLDEVLQGRMEHSAIGRTLLIG